MFSKAGVNTSLLLPARITPPPPPRHACHPPSPSSPVHPPSPPPPTQPSPPHPTRTSTSHRHGYNLILFVSALVCLRVWVCVCVSLCLCEGHRGRHFFSESQCTYDSRHMHVSCDTHTPVCVSYMACRSLPSCAGGSHACSLTFQSLICWSQERRLYFLNLFGVRGWMPGWRRCLGEAGHFRTGGISEFNGGISDMKGVSRV